MSYPIKSPRKLIEVALPLDAINVACAKEKSIRHGHPSTLHLWWARRPLAAARAVLFAQLVNDPGYQQGGGFKYGKNKKEAAIERKRLFKIIEDLVLWENTTNEEVLERARAEIRRSWREVCELNNAHPQADELFNPDRVPAFHDPFAGGGAIPLEAQRLGLEAFASDLNPVAVLLNKAMIEIPPRFVGCQPVGPVPRGSQTSRTTWPGAAALAEDVRRYGAWVSAEAEKRIGHLYPPVEITKAIARERPDLAGLVGERLTVVAWLWARTVRSPSPAFSQTEVPLVSTFVLSSQKDRNAYVVPVVDGNKYRFTVAFGEPPASAVDGTKVSGRGANFRCVLSDAPISGDYIKSEGQAARLGIRLMAIVVEGKHGRSYLSPTLEQEAVAREVRPQWRPEGDVPARLTGGTCVPYGLKHWGDLYTPRQLVGLTTFADLVAEARDLVRRNAAQGGLPDDGVGLESGGSGASAYSDAVATYLAFSVSRLADRSSSICTWDLREGQGRKPGVRNVFSRQAIPMSWDFAEANPFSGIAASADSAIQRIADVLERLDPKVPGFAVQADAAKNTASMRRFVSIDPPYYNNIAYADLSDFFYVWLRRALRQVFPRLLATISVPKMEELVATPYRHGGKEEADAFFLDGMTCAMEAIAKQAHPAAPITIYYAFKQAETKGDAGTSSTGWETFLRAVLRAGLSLTGTWPLRTELSNRMLGSGTNSLASSIVLVCRPRAADAPSVSRREFQRELNAVLPEALDEMTRGSGDERSPVAPVDLSQAIIGPGMAVFSKYSAVLEANGEPMSVQTALQLINRFLAEDDFDRDTQFCLHWFEQNGWQEGSFGDADTLARAKGTSVDGAKDAGVIKSGASKVRLLKWSEYPSDWDPKTDTRNPVWETLHHLIRALKRDGEPAAGALLAAVRGQGESVRQLAYRLYTLCERQGWAEDARAYNELITSWTAIESAAGAVPPATQGNLFEGD